MHPNSEGGFFYVTTPIYYVNDVPHIGHAYTTVAADVLTRYRRLEGRDSFFLTGTDEHGQKVEKAARERGVDPKTHCDQMVVRFQSLWKKLNISNNDFIRTTEPRHQTVVQKILQDLYDRGEIYQDDYEGWYCVPCERFWTEKDLVEGKCPDCLRPVVEISEKNYFFRMSQYQSWLIDHIEKNDRFVLPSSRRNEILGFLRNPLDDLCISRPKKRLGWGIEIPFDTDYVTYVWFDALINYISGIGYGSDGRFSGLWQEAVHLIGKDILTTHTVYWPIMLKAMGLTPPKTVFAHGWWTVDGQKMSKSLQNVVEPNRLIDTYGTDAVRYFLMREVPFGLDGDFSHSAMIHRINSDLANDLGNLFSRALSMVLRYFGGVTPAPAPSEEEADRKLMEVCRSAPSQMKMQMDDFAFNRALGAVWEIVAAANKYVDETGPWALAKEEKNRPRLGTVLYNVLESLRIIALSLAPFMPSTCERMWSQLGVEEDLWKSNLERDGKWGLLKPGAKITKPEPLFPRIDPKKSALS